MGPKESDTTEWLSLHFTIDWNFFFLQLKSASLQLLPSDPGSAPRPAQYISGPQTPFSLLRSTYISLGVGPTDQGPCPQNIPPPTHTFTMKAKILRKINSEQMSKLYFKLAGKVPVDSGAWRAIQSMESQRVRNDWSNPAQGILKQLKFESCLSRYSFQFLKQPFPKTVFVDRLFPCAVFFWFEYQKNTGFWLKYPRLCLF